jgi:threonine/homoserine/homoserine lactone efflux protein
MGEAIGGALPLAVGVALSPVPIIGVTLMLATPGGRGNGIAFILGWVGGLAVAGAVFLLLAGTVGAAEGGEPADWVSYLKLALGVLLLLVAVRQWRSRPHDGEEPPMPKWMRSIDGFKAPKAAALAVLLAAVNPKNLLLVVAATAAISQTGITAGEQAVAYAIFVIIATVGPGAPLAIYLLLRDRSAAILASLRTWMTLNNGAIMAVICLVIGAKLIGDGVAGLS